MKDEAGWPFNCKACKCHVLVMTMIVCRSACAMYVLG